MSTKPGAIQFQYCVECGDLGWLQVPSIPRPDTHFATVLRDNLVVRAISRPAFFLPRFIGRILPIMSMVITPRPPLLKHSAG